MYCIHCGKELSSDEKFCTSCGNPTGISPIHVTQTLPVIVEVVNDNKIEQKKKSNFKPIYLLVIFPIILLFLVLNLFLSGDNTRTIMIYMVGADLESRAGLGSRDLQDLDYQKTKNNKVKVILIAGGSKSWQNNYIKSNETSIYELKENGFVKVKTKSLENMGGVNTLSYFLNYVYHNYKSKQYDLIFWNHGGAIDGSEYDELNKNDNLKITEMKSAFQNSPFKHKKLEVLSFRTCLNATLEMANALKDYAKYLVASEEVTIGSDMDSALRFINDITPKDNGIGYGKKQIKVYLETVTNCCNASSRSNLEENYCVNTTYSLIDLSKINNINKNLDIFSKDLNSKLNSNYQDIARIRTNLSSYADTEQESYEMVDLYDLVSSYEKYSNNSKNLLNSIEKAVIINQTNNNYSHGISIYYPFYNGYFVNTYSTITPSNNYNTFSNNFFQYRKTNKSNAFDSFIMQKGELQKDSENKENADFEMDLTTEQEENYANGDCYVFADMKDGTYKLVYLAKKPYIEDHKLKVRIKGKLLKISDFEYEDDSQWLTLWEDTATDTLSTSVILTNGINNMIVATIKFIIDDDNPNGKIVSVTTDDSSKNENLNLFSKRTIKIEDYFTIISASDSYNIKDENGNFNPNFMNEGKKGIYTGYEFVTDSYKFIKETFDSDIDFYAVFRITDIYGNKYYSNISKMKVGD